MKKLILSVLTFIVALSSISLANCIGDISQVGNASCITEYSDDTDIEEMDTVTFGSYPQSSSNSKEPIEWIVLDKQGNKALLLSKYIINQLPYDQKYIHNGWKSSFLNKFLNEEFIYDAFNENEQNLIIYTNVKNTAYDVYSNKLHSYNFNSKIFLLSYSECKKYFGANSEDKLPYKVLSSKTNYAISNYGAYNGVTSSKKHYPEDAMNFWLRDSHAENEGGQNFTCFVEYNNDYDSIWITSDAANIPIGVRPAMWVDLSISDNVGAYEENNNYVDDNSNIDDDTYEDYDEDNEEDEIPEDYSNAGNMAKSDTVTWGMNGIDVTFKRVDLKQGWVKDVEGRKFYFNTYDAVNESCNFPTGWKEIDGQYYYFTDHGYILINTTTPDGYKVDRNGVLIEEVQETTKVPETTKPAPKNGWYGDYYYQNDVMVTNNWVEYNGEWYYCGPSGAILKNQWIDKTYYVDDTGKMLRNTTTPTGNKVGADGKYIPDEVIDLDARNNINKQEETKKQEPEKKIQETKKQENRKTEETQEIPQYVLDAWANRNITTEQEPYILSDDGSTITFQITARTSAGVHAELYVTDPGYEYSNGLFDKTHATVEIDVAYSLLTNKDREVLSKISNSTVCAVDDGVGGKYDYSMAKKTGPCINNNQIILPTISRKEATRIVNELNKKLDNDEKIIIKVQYAEHDTEKGKYAVNPIYIGRGKVVVKQEGLIFKSLPSMYVEFEGEAKKKLEEYTRKNKGKYLYLTNSLVDDGSGYVNEVKYFEDDDWLQELANQMNENNDREDYHTLQVITKTISDGKVHVNLLGNQWVYKDPKIFSDADTSYEYALRNASGFPTDLYIIDRMEYYTK